MSDVTLEEYEIRMPTLEEFPRFFELSDAPKALVAELLKVCIYRDGVAQGARIPLQHVVPLMTRVSNELFPKKE